MSALRGLDDGFGDHNTFALALVGLRSVIDQFVGLLPDLDPAGDARLGTAGGTGDAGLGTPGGTVAARATPDSFEHLVLGVVSLQGLLAELCDAGSDDEAPGPAAERPVAADGPTDPPPGSNEVRQLLR